MNVTEGTCHTLHTSIGLRHSAVDLLWKLWEADGTNMLISYFYEGRETVKTEVAMQNIRSVSDLGTYTQAS